MDDEDEDDEYNVLENEGGGDRHNEHKQNSKRLRKEDKMPFNALVSTKQIILMEIQINLTKHSSH